MIKLDTIKKHLNIDNYFTDDDLYILSLKEVSMAAVEADLGCKLCEIYEKYGCIPEPIKHAVLLMIGTFYQNRESVSVAALHPVPLSYQYLLDLYRRY